MQYRDFRDWRISSIGVGCYGLSGAYGSVDRDAYQATLQRAYELGVNFFDTAEAYGEAEEFLGRAIHPFRDKIYIATKVSGEGGLKPDLSEATVRAACHASLEKLGTSTIDLYQVHFDDPDTPVEVTVAALERLKQEGKIRQYGVCHLPVEKIEDYLDCGQVFSILMELSAVARTSLQTLLPLCREHNLAALAFSVTGRGVLTGKIERSRRFEAGDIRRMDPLFQRERFDSALRVARKFAQLGGKYNASSAQMAIAWTLAQEGVICALTGPSRAAHLEENVGASQLEIEPDDLHAIETFLQAEESNLAEGQRASVRSILSERLPTEPEAAFNDLVYAFETAIILGMASESEILPLFRELFALHKELDASSLEKLAEIQSAARELLL